ncbi:exported hypothetical protein [Vibrio crassostreae]|uniref:Uncharacterized protein n=1 Tax=Vibrio crassostreae TaxID=246167 RepID=A0A822N8P2_9VIBR|nr:exported hypothetical protein [Vibrio crassostreae]
MTDSNNTILFSILFPLSLGSSGWDGEPNFYIHLVVLPSIYITLVM